MKSVVNLMGISSCLDSCFIVLCLHLYHFLVFVSNLHWSLDLQAYLSGMLKCSSSNSFDGPWCGSSKDPIGLLELHGDRSFKLKCNLPQLSFAPLVEPRDCGACVFLCYAHP